MHDLKPREWYRRSGLHTQYIVKETVHPTHAQNDARHRRAKELPDHASVSLRARTCVREETQHEQKNLRTSRVQRTSQLRIQIRIQILEETIM